MYKIMTPGPTMVRENVRIARSTETTNPDIDTTFCEYYKETCDLISSLLNTKNETYILSGEGILGLEAACASITEKDDKVLVIDNGIYGKGFADFVSIYGGIPILYTVDYKNTIDVDKLAKYLEKNHNFKYATVVHCDTPSGMLNDIDKICPLLKSYNILTVVDSVSGMFANEVNIDKSQIDILCGGSQKAVSAPIGLTFVTISQDAMKVMETRKTPIASFYANLLIFKNYYKDKWFPYTMPISDIYGLRTAIENIKNDKNIIKRHEIIARATRQAITNCGLNLHLESGFSNSVTVFNVPQNTDAKSILDTMKNDYNIMLAGSFDILAGQVIRIGHMGENATIDNMKETMLALDKTFKKLNIKLNDSLYDNFVKLINLTD